MRKSGIRGVATIFGLGLSLAGIACTPTEKPDVADPASRREAPAGTFVGTRDVSGNHAWRGIPYAEAPTGDRRWNAPAAPAPRSGVFEAIDAGAACPQFASRFGGDVLVRASDLGRKHTVMKDGINLDYLDYLDYRDGERVSQPRQAGEKGDNAWLADDNP